MLEVNHGGYFDAYPILYYKNGKKSFFEIVVDKMSFFEIKGFVDELKYTDIIKMHWLVASRSMNYLRILLDDNSAKDIIEATGTQHSLIELYLEHENHYPVELDTDCLNEQESVESENDDGSDEVDDVVDINNEEVQELHSDSDVNSTEGVSDDELRTVRQDKQSGVHNELPSIIGFGEDKLPSIIGDITSADDYYSPDETDEEDAQDVGRRKRGKKKIKYPIWNPKSDVFKFVPVKGWRFADTNQLRDCIIAYAVNNGLPLRFEKINKDIVLAKCASNRPWRLWATKMSSEMTVQITSLCDEHRMEIERVSGKCVRKVLN
ncbi:hypothetical protein FRX31_023828 [Thalictrum thalictroides]|uniref:Transposase MuDR plant domain-containing protein n=1 Tax=Thalictrum thalictroides TaxID=46969 RepID=A0A7J6VNC1_THATH|nr:hypothetical protein FRX31_023828 [Thalictrum thalictroides]